MKPETLLAFGLLFPCCFLMHDFQIYHDFNKIRDESILLVEDNIDSERQWSYGLDESLMLICLQGCREDLSSVSRQYSFMLRGKHRYAFSGDYPNVVVTY